jgi:hypothetical protein
MSKTVAELNIIFDNAEIAGKTAEMVVAKAICIATACCSFLNETQPY